MVCDQAGALGCYLVCDALLTDRHPACLPAACGPPGGGRQEVSPRFLRHFTSLCVPPPSDEASKAIFSAILNGFLAVGVRNKQPGYDRISRRHSAPFHLAEVFTVTGCVLEQSKDTLHAPHLNSIPTLVHHPTPASTPCCRTSLQTSSL